MGADEDAHHRISEGGLLTLQIPVCSTTRVKSAIVFSLMVDGSGSRQTYSCSRKP